MIQVPDTEKRNAIAAFALFTTEPTDRALAGWNPEGWVDQERAEMRMWVREEAPAGGGS